MNDTLENKYICEYCGYISKNLSGLNFHINVKHLKVTKINVKYELCPHCNKEIWVGAYNKHKEKCLQKQIENNKHYYCKRCGKLVTKKYGNGIYCSRYCANSHILSDETKRKISIGVKNNPSGWASENNKYNNKQNYINRINKYYENPNKCKICRKILDYKHKHRKTCSSKECLKIIQSKNGGYKKHSRKGNAGYYKGFYCDSTYELIFLIYCLDHDIPIIRNKEYFIYEYNGKKYRYYPDFLINNRMLIEIKNFNSDIVKLKLNSVDRPIKILYGKDLLKIAQYVADKYNINFNKHLNKINGNFKCLYENK